MIVDDAPDPILRGLGRLAVLTPDEQRARRLRARCRAQMQRAPTPTRIVGPVVFTGLCVLYLSALALDVLRLPGRL